MFDQFARILFCDGAKHADAAVEGAEHFALVHAADLVVTGEGAFDWQSLRGKTVSGVAAAALAQARPVVVLAGRVEVGRREFTAIGVNAAFAVVEEAGSVDAALAEPAARLADTAARAARTWGG